MQIQRETHLVLFLVLSALAVEKGCFLEGNLFNCFMHFVDCRNGPGRSRAHAPGTRLGPPTHLHDEMQEGRPMKVTTCFAYSAWGQTSECGSVTRS